MNFIKAERSSHYRARFCLKVIAEGVETEEELKSLAELHVHIMQGFYFSKPLPADKFESLLEKREFPQAA